MFERSSSGISPFQRLRLAAAIQEVQTTTGWRFIRCWRRRRDWAELGPVAHKTAGSGFERRTPARRAKAMDGFRKRLFDIDLEHCPHCRGPLKSIAAIVDSTVIVKILIIIHLGLPARAPPRSPARLFDQLPMA